MSKFHLIGLTGRMGSGKDTAAQMLMKFDAYRKVAFAAPLKQMIATVLGVDPAVLEDRDYKETVHPDFNVTPRYMMQTLGTEWGRELIHPEIWLKIAKNRIEHYLSYRHVVVTDVRFDNEAKMIRAMGGQIVHITRGGAGFSSTHTSEAPVTPHWSDQVVANEGTLRVLELKMKYIYELMVENHESKKPPETS